MTYLLLGEDTAAKAQKIIEIKAKCIPAAAMSFDYELLYGHKLYPEVLKKALITLPVMANQRLILIHQAQKLSPYNQELLVAHLQDNPKQLVAILDFDESKETTIVNTFKPFAKVLTFGQGKASDTFDMTRAIGSRRASDALKILHDLLDQGIHPLQILGGVVWFWGRHRERISAGNYQKGLQVLEEADLNIKRSRLKPEYAVEKAVVELAGLA